MSLLIDAAPTAVEIGGRDWEIRSDFRISIQFEQLMLDAAVPDDLKLGLALELYYPVPPTDPLAAAERALWFYQCGRPAGRSGKAGGHDPGRVYDYDQDDAQIYAAFMADYGIDLEACDLHWWKFRALFDGLAPDNLICRIMEWRAADVKAMKGEQRAYYRRMQKLYALRRPAAEQAKLDEIGRALMGDGNLTGLR